MRHRSSQEDLLTRLADGTIDPAERGRLEQAVAGSPQLAALLAEQRRALALAGGLEIEAPAALHQRIAAGETRRPRARRWPSRRVALVLVAAAVVFVLLAARIHTTSVRSEVHLALAAAVLPAPAPDARDPSQLAAAVAGVTFPDWSRHGWIASGARSDSFDGHGVETVFYTSREYSRLGYSIVAGAPLSIGAAEQTLTRGGVAYSVLKVGGATVVTWERDGHTCVLASQHAPARVLLRLAHWA